MEARPDHAVRPADRLASTDLDELSHALMEERSLRLLSESTLEEALAEV